ncbi:hypothetical protein IQ263_26825 [Tychonema sp. LEGE 06208]|nr:hypothetical protein [Tychonema sp. LEGE 06208]
MVISYWSLVIGAVLRERTFSVISYQEEGRKNKAEKRRSEEGFSDRREGVLVAIDG